MTSETDGHAVLVIDGQRLALDASGHLQDPAAWRPAVAEALAELDGIRLSADHWWLIEFVRHHHHKYGTPPLMRVVMAAYRVHAGDDRLTSRALYRLFPDNPVRQACLYGGLPKPDWCI
jgi:TusE/DsrC/DsvC family sulfur relay protein